jgi:hypothetical protein
MGNESEQQSGFKKTRGARRSFRSRIWAFEDVEPS